MLQLFNNNRQTCYTKKSFRNYKILVTKKLKRKLSFGKFGKFGADFQRQPFTDIFLNRCS